jgi:hypothetical protein
VSLDALVGHLTLRPNAEPSIVCDRPMVSAALMRRLTEGRRASLLPDLIATVFTLGATAQRSTSRRAVLAALGGHDDPAAAERDGLMLGLVTAREHLQRLALDIPTHAPQPGSSADPHWLRDAPVMALPAQSAGPGERALRDAEAALPSWLERRLFGMPPAQWLEAWQRDPADWLERWSTGRDQPVASWLAAARTTATAVALPCRPLDALAAGDSGLRELATALAADPDFAERPLWHGVPAETGPWTRAGRPTPVATLWERLGARLADLAAISLGRRLAFGAAALGSDQGLAWSEMSRGLLVHWLRLEEGPRQADTARAACYRVLAPTEWNFHPDGVFGRALREGRLGAEGARLAAVALDPCITFDVEAAGA